jgi:hypothetical protein
MIRSAVQNRPVATLAVVIPFPEHRVKRARRMADVFAPLREQAELERAVTRFVWSCALATTFVSVVLQLSIG